MVIGKSPSLSVNFWQLRSDCHDVLTSTVYLYHLVVKSILHLHTYVGMYYTQICMLKSIPVSKDATTPETMSNAIVTVRHIDRPARYNGKEFQESLSKIQRVLLCALGVHVCTVSEDDNER